MCSVLSKSVFLCHCIATLSLCTFLVICTEASAASPTENTNYTDISGPETENVDYAETSGSPVKTFDKRYTIYFRINRWDIDTTFRGNGATIRKMQREIDSLIATGRAAADSVSIVSAASPDGRDAFNVWLSRKRGLAAHDLLEKLYPEIDPEIIFIDPVGEDWDAFREIVRQDKDIPYRDSLMALLGQDGLSADAKERRLRQMAPAFRYIIEHHIYRMRAASVTFSISMPLITLEQVTEPAAPRLEILRGDIAYPRHPETVHRPESSLESGPTDRKMILAARTNLLVPALNVGIEVPIGCNWSVGADYYFPWWLAKSNRYCIEMLGWFVDTKYWFGKDRTETDKLAGHALGGYAGFGYYDFQWEKSGNQGEFIDIGIDYTYSLPLAKDRLRMEFNIGLGWIHTVARHYTPTDDYTDLIKDPGIRHRKYNFFGPTRASVSLIVPIRVKTGKKGGAR